MQVPEGDAVYLVAKPAEGLEQTLVLSRMECLYGVAHADALCAEVQLPAHLLAGTDVEFRDMDMLHERLQSFFSVRLNFVTELSWGLAAHSCVFGFL